jgi:hemerythrin superfamily protein
MMSDQDGVSRRQLAKLAGVGTVAVMVAPGLIAATASRAQQAPASPAQSGAFEILMQDHKKIAGLMQKMLDTPASDTQTRSNLLTQLKQTLTRHGVAEENVVYPAVRQQSLTGIDALQAVKEHADIKSYLYTLEMTPKNEQAWTDQLRKLQGEVNDHVQNEEKDMFPSLRSKLSPEQVTVMTQMVVREMKEC